MELPRDSVPQFMSLNEVAKILKVSRWTVNRWIKTKNLPVVYFTDRTPRVPWDQFEIWMKTIQEGGEGLNG